MDWRRSEDLASGLNAILAVVDVALARVRALVSAQVLEALREVYSSAIQLQWRRVHRGALRRRAARRVKNLCLGFRLTCKLAGHGIGRVEVHRQAKLEELRVHIVERVT